MNFHSSLLSGRGVGGPMLRRPLEPPSVAPVRSSSS